ncbi:MAG: hypothetical protein JSS37_06395 [Proteobacteria bacterium]|nr:hypothetical protein [Pseudomonadota bacterium]
MDDEYFRVTLAVRDDLPDVLDSRFLREQTRKMLRDPKSMGFRAAIGKATFLVPSVSKTGERIGERVGLKVDAYRVERTAKRMIRGLYSKYFQTILPVTHDVIASLLDMQRDTSAFLSTETQELLVLLREQGTHQSFGNVLEITYAKADGDEHASFWWVKLHGTFNFFGFTLPREG